MLDLGLHYIHFPIKTEGQIIGITIGKTGTIARFGKASLIGQFAPGFGYSTNPYSKENNKNLNISTHIGLFVHSNLSLNFPIYKNWYGLFGFGFNHLSNASIQRPNYGYNTLTTKIGTSYLLKQNRVPAQNENYDKSRKYYYHLFGSYFKTSSGYWDGERQNSFGLHSQIERNISASHSILLGCDYNYRKELHPVEKPADEESDNLAHYLGISTGVNWKIGIIDLNASFGAYLLKPWTYSKKTYSLLHSKTYFLKNYYLLIGLKAHKFRAELFEAGIGVKL
ncbi:hypothetical protein SLH46_03330 [Draconibacterium sp. IB214405]|uniref:hypothetical protein n=1 Tax=Draconibacterium sp. IB214405 TaxID=3097352 RepID=UPI002A0F31BD|nr:hypothetical protein [Draconibacterium sp. IB214405]MDX8338201.1 hypothetical protein [Draconibacterium sp. IB214405]